MNNSPAPGNRGRSLAARRSQQTRSAGFTMLELVLALALSAIILMAVGMSVQLHLRSFDSRHRILEESQLARSILRIIADDIRSVVVHYEQDLSGLESLLSSGGGGGGGDAGGDGAASGGGEVPPDSSAEPPSGADSGTTEQDASTNTADLSTTAVLPAKPGIYGNQYELQIDVSRLPRVDEYQQILSVDPGAELMDIPSDIKTVSYFVQDSTLGTTTAARDPLAPIGQDPQSAQGLVRRELDRAVSEWALMNSSASALMESGELLASEVVGVEFQYFDGIDWLGEWDTETLQALPVAIQVVLMMTSSASDDGLAAAVDPQGATIRYYRLVVHLPVGNPAASDPATSGEGMAL